MSGRAPLTAADIATLVEGRLIGDPAARVASVAPLDRAGPADVSFFASGKYLADFETSHAGAVLLTTEHSTHTSGPAVRIVVKDPHAAMLKVVRALYPNAERPSGVHPTATIGKGATIGAEASLGPHVVIGEGARIGARAVIMAGCVVGAGVQLGDDVTLYPNVVCYPGTIVGNRVILHAGVVLASDGFGYVQNKANESEKIPHVGRCIIRDDVEIGANTTIDRGSVDDTVVGEMTKIDNLVQIGHNCRIGKRCLIMAQVGMAGSMRVEDDVILAGQAGLIGHRTIGKGARIGAQSGVTGDVPPGAMVSGYPARNHKELMRAWAAMYRLADIVDDLEALVEAKRGR